jgi:hypothetical protein
MSSSSNDKEPPLSLRLTSWSGEDPTPFSARLRALGESFRIFLERLEDFPDFEDKDVGESIQSLSSELLAKASCIEAYARESHLNEAAQDLSKNITAQYYIRDLMTEIERHLANVTSSLTVFVDTGLPALKFNQEQDTTNLISLSAIATLFSGVTATTLQMSYFATETAVEQAVNTFYFASLIFSVAAAVNSLLGLAWRQST